MSQPATTVTIAIDLLQLAGAVVSLVLFFAGIVLTFGKMLLRQFELRLGEKFQSRDQSLKEIREKIESVERHGRNVEGDMLRLQALLPNEYVRREDWIRFSGTIDAKLDYLRTKCEDTAHSLVKIMERLKVGGSNDAR